MKRKLSQLLRFKFDSYLIIYIIY